MLVVIRFIHFQIQELLLSLAQPVGALHPLNTSLWVAAAVVMAEIILVVVAVAVVPAVCLPVQ